MRYRWKGIVQYIRYEIFASLEGDLYSSPKKYKPNREAQAIYRGRVDRARKAKGLEPIDWSKVD